MGRWATCGGEGGAVRPPLCSGSSALPPGLWTLWGRAVTWAGDGARWSVLLGALWAEAKVRLPGRVRRPLGQVVTSGRGWPAGVPISLIKQGRAGYQRTYRACSP